MFTTLTRRMMMPAIAFALAAATTFWAHPAPAEELRVMAWQGYADDDWVKEFEKETGAKVNVVFIGTDDEIWAKIKGSEGKDFDLFAVNTAQLQRYIDAGLATPYDLDKVPNQRETLPRFRDLTQVSGRHARRQDLRDPLRLRFHRPHLRHRQGEARAGFHADPVGPEIQGEGAGL